MHNLIRRALVVAGAAVVVLGPAAGVASAGSGTVKLGWSPSGTVSFGAVNPGATSPPQAFKLTNSGSTGSGALKITLTPASGTPASAFTKTADTCTGTSLGPNKSCSVSVTYTAPATPGSYQATLAAASNKPTATASVTLTGVSKASPAITTSPSGGPVGGKGEVTDTATLSNGISPTGTITFRLYGPSATADCSTLVDTETATVNGNGSYGTPFGYSPTQAGTYWWTASYGGDASNNPASSGCGAEQAAVSQATPAFTTTPNPAIATVGTTVYDTATLSGGYNPTGFISFALSGPFAPGATPDCSGPFASVENVTVNGNGSYTTAFGQAPDQPGVYYWTASYSGDTNNTGPYNACGDEPVTIVTCLVTDTTSNQNYTSLAEAVTAAAAGDTLIVKGTCTGTTEIGKDLTLTGQPSGSTPAATLDGGANGTVLTIDTGATVTVNSLTITNGASPSVTGRGGGGIVNDGTVTLNSSSITGSTGSGDAGGIFNDPTGTVTLNNSSITGNTADVYGGGVYNLGTMILNNSSISGNTGGRAGGGAVNDALYGGGTMTLNGSSSIASNTLQGDGGGVENVNGATLTLNDTSSITGNQAPGGQGGGVDNDAAVILNGSSTITGNTAGTNGGGIYNDRFGTVTLNGSSTITGNTAGADGGGIYNECGGTLNNAFPGTGHNVYNNTPDDIANAC